MTEHTTPTAPATPIDSAPFADFLHDDEKILLVTRQHMLMLAASFLKTLLWTIASVAAWYFSGRLEFLDNDIGSWIRLVLLLPVVFFIPHLLWDVLVWRRARMVVTDEKVLYVSGVFNRSVESTPLVKIDDIAVEQPLFGRTFGYGKLLVDDQAGGKHPLYDLHYIQDPAGAYRLISGLARKNRAWEGGAQPGSRPE